MARHQTGYVWRKGSSWFGRWREDAIEDGRIVRRQRCVKLADVCDRYRCKADVLPLLEEKLVPLNQGKVRPESTMSVSNFVETFYLPFVEENYKPSTSAGYKTYWSIYLSPRMKNVTLRDFRTVDAANLLADLQRRHNLGRSTLKHIKSLLSGVFSYAKNQGVLEGMNPIRDTMIPRKAASSGEMHAATPDEVLAIIKVLKDAKQERACAAVALMFFAGLRPGEARGVKWEDYDGKRITVRQSVWRTHTTSPKTASSAKPVPVIEPLTSILTSLRAADGNPSSGPILRGPSGKPLDLHNLANRVVRPTLHRCAICKKPKIKHAKADHKFQLDESVPGWNGWYSLRRGVGTAVTCLSKGSLAAKGLLRHSSVSTTERHYIKDVPETTLQAMKQLEALCNECATPARVKPS